MEILDYFKQLCNGMKYLHDNKIIHRDLSDANVFLTEYGDIKIGDFGHSKELLSSKAQTKYLGTPIFNSPELI